MGVEYDLEKEKEKEKRDSDGDRSRMAQRGRLESKATMADLEKVTTVKAIGKYVKMRGKTDDLPQ